MAISVILFVLGLFVLTKGASILVRAGAALAHFLGVSGLVIGVLIAGIGTSIPEFAVAFISNLIGENDVGLGTIIGSNTFNLLFILGLCALFYPLYLKREWVTRDLVWNVVAVFATMAAAAGGLITRFEGLLMTILCIVWMTVVARSSAKEREEGVAISAFLLSFLLAIAGLVGVLVGSYFVVDGAVAIALDLGVSEALVGLLIVGIGTSLPEVAVSLTAAAKRQYGIAVGNIIGSNVFDFLGIIGITAVARPVTFERILLIDITVTAGAAILVLYLAFMSKGYRLGRWHGALLLLLYAVYLAFVIARG